MSYKRRTCGLACHTKLVLNLQRCILRIYPKNVMLNKDKVVKPVIFTQHSQLQMLLRGADKDEVLEVIQKGQRESAKYGRIQAKLRFVFGKSSPITGIVYRFKDVEAIFKEETNEMIVVTEKFTTQMIRG